MFCFVRNDFSIKPKYLNTLPDIPCDPKHIILPADPKEFELTTNELNRLYTQFIADVYCGGKLDLVGSSLTDAKSKGGQEELHPADRFLMEDDDTKGLLLLE